MKNLFYLLAFLLLLIFSCEPEKKKDAVVSITIKEVQSVDGETATFQWASAFYGEDEAIPDVTLAELNLPYIQRLESEVEGKAFTFRAVSKKLVDVTVKVNGKTAYNSQGKEHKPTTEIILRKYD